MECLSRIATPNGAGWWLGGRGVPSRPWLLPMECRWGMAYPNGTCRLTVGTGSPAQLVVAAYGAPARECSPQKRRPTHWGGGEPCHVRGRCLWSAVGGWQPPTAHGHWPSGWGCLLNRCSSPMESMWGDSSPQRRPVTGCEERETYPFGGHCPWNAYVGLLPLTLQVHRPGYGEYCSIRRRCLWSAYGGWQPSAARAHGPEGKGTFAQPVVNACGVSAGGW